MLFLRKYLKLLTEWYTSCKWISCIFDWTGTYRIMFHNATFSFNTAGPNARINTFLITTSSVKWTVRTDHTLRSTKRWASYISKNTGTYCLPIYFSALTVRSTRRRDTRVCYNGYWNNRKC